MADEIGSLRNGICVPQQQETAYSVTEPKTATRFESLDALRGIAILAVMLLHFGERGVGRQNGLVHEYLWSVLSHGYLGVQIFFVISGYCITAICCSTSSGKRSLLKFFRRRARRIYPPYWASVVLVVLMGLATVFFVGRTWQSVFPLAATDWMLGLLLLQGPFGAPDISLVYWMLSIMIQFYVVMAVCLRCGRFGEWILLLMSVISAVLLAMQQFSPSGTVFRYWHEFAAGIAAFYLITGANRWRWTPWCLVGLAALAGLHNWHESHAMFQSNGRLSLAFKILFCLTLMSTLVLAHRHDSRISGWRFYRALGWFGAISYSLYLTHVPLGTRVFNLGERVTGLDGDWWLFYTFVAFAISVGLGWCFFKLCEEPWLNRHARAGIPVVPSATEDGHPSVSADG